MWTTKPAKPRSYRVVGPQQQVDERTTPHPRVERGELGDRLLNWRKTRAGQDPFRRIFGVGGGDPNNCLQLIMKKAPEGVVNPNPVPIPEPTEMARRIKEIARFFGADVVGITHLDQAYVYSHRAKANPAAGEKVGDPVHVPHRYAICLGFSSDYYRFLSNNSRISDAEYGLGNQRMIPTTFMLASYIREMGYPAQSHDYSKSGYKILLNAADHYSILAGAIGASLKKLREQPDQVKRFLRANVKGLRYMQENRSAALETMVRWLKVDREMAEGVYELAINNFAL